jgi:acyl carrier protein
MDDRIRQILDEVGHLSRPAASMQPDDDLYLLGLTSHATVNVMLALEDEFEIEFPEQMLRRATFQSLANIRTALLELTSAP